MPITPHSCAPRPAQRRNLRMPRIAEPNVFNIRKHPCHQQATLSTYLSDEAAGTMPHNASVYRKRRPRQTPFTLEYRMQRRSGHIRLHLIAFATCLHLSAQHMRLRVGFAPQVLISALFLHFMPLVPGFNRLYSTYIHFVAFSARIRPLLRPQSHMCSARATRHHLRLRRFSLPVRSAPSYRPIQAITPNDTQKRPPPEPVGAA